MLQGAVESASATPKKKKGGTAAVREGDEVRARKREELLSKLQAAQDRSRATRAPGGVSARAPGLAPRHEVVEADVARVISQWTGIPLTKLVESEADKLLHLGDELHG